MIRDNIRIPDISWVTDKKLYEILERDFRDLETCKSNKLWKPSMVLAGGIAEALLLYALNQDRKRAEIGLEVLNKKPRKKRKNEFRFENLNKYALDTLIKIADSAGILEQVDNSLLDAFKDVRDLRNIIHPGKELRAIEKGNLLVDETGARKGELLLDSIIRSLDSYFDDIIFLNHLSPSFDIKDRYGFEYPTDLKYKGYPSFRITGKWSDYGSKNSISCPNFHGLFKHATRKHHVHLQVYIDNENPPEMLLLQFHIAKGRKGAWWPRIYWGMNQMILKAEPNKRVDFVLSKYAGKMPPNGEWTSLHIDLESDFNIKREDLIDGMAFSLSHRDDETIRTVNFANVIFSYQ